MTSQYEVVKDFFDDHSIFTINGKDTIVTLEGPMTAKEKPDNCTLKVEVTGKPESATYLYLSRKLVFRIIARKNKAKHFELTDNVEDALTKLTELIRKTLITKSVEKDSTVIKYWGKFTVNGPADETDKGKKPADDAQDDSESSDEAGTSESALTTSPSTSQAVVPATSPLNASILAELQKLNGVIVNQPPPGYPRLTDSLDAASLQEALDQGYTLMRLEKLAGTRPNPVAFAGRIITQVNPDGTMDYGKQVNIRMKAEAVARNGFNPQDLIQLSRDVMNELRPAYDERTRKVRSAIRGSERNLQIAAAVRERRPKKKR